MFRGALSNKQQACEKMRQPNPCVSDNNFLLRGGKAGGVCSRPRRCHSRLQEFCRSGGLCHSLLSHFVTTRAWSLLLSDCFSVVSLSGCLCAEAVGHSGKLAAIGGCWELREDSHILQSNVENSQTIIFSTAGLHPLPFPLQPPAPGGPRKQEPSATKQHTTKYRRRQHPIRLQP